jgi:ATP-binding cassette subfamily F protein 3
VIFTAHDRHFTTRVASCIIEVKDGTVVNYRGDYDAYLYMVNKEIDQDENERNGMVDQKQRKAEPSKATSSKPSPNTGSPDSKGSSNKSPSNKSNRNSSSSKPTTSNDERAIKKAIGQLEKTIARLDGERKQLNEKYMQATDSSEAVKLHQELTRRSKELETAESRWIELQEQI